jgi:hypothetical protein
MGLAEVAKERAKIIGINKSGISTDLIVNELYDEVCKMMISENDRFKEVYNSLSDTIKFGKVLA